MPTEFRRFATVAFVGFCLVSPRAEPATADAAATPACDPLTAAAHRIAEHIQVLSADDFEGRGPGTPGETKTVAYLTQELKNLGLAPGNPAGTYVQAVPMVGIVPRATTVFHFGEKTMTPVWINDYIAFTHRVTPSLEVKDSGLVFAGYGIVAPEYGWDDFKDVDVRGKTIVVLVNNPRFKGSAMTYYGRWTYKFEEAAAKGAAGCLIVHETGPAGYPFAVVAASNGRENFTLDVPAAEAAKLPVEGWLTLGAAQRLFTAGGWDFAQLKAAALRREFRPVALHGTATIALNDTVRKVASTNVVAKLEGSDPAVRDQWIVYSAHWDHLGRDPRLRGDQIFNGAADNAAGDAIVLEAARHFSQLPVAERPRRSLLFLFTTGEEKGLLGAKYYAENPLYPLAKTLADINVDTPQTWGPARDIEVIGYGNSTLDDLATVILARAGRVAIPDSEPEKGYFYRSDHFEFAKEGVPAFYNHPGIDIIGRPAGYGKMRREEYYANDYHKVSDEIKPEWDLRGAAADAQLYIELGRRVAEGETWPEWKPGCEFKAKRDAMLAPQATGAKN